MRFNNNQLIIFINKLISRSNWVSDELTFNASDNDDIPEEPIVFAGSEVIQQTLWFYWQIQINKGRIGF